jgi:hypothetical protein
LTAEIRSDSVEEGVIHLLRDYVLGDSVPASSAIVVLRATSWKLLSRSSIVRQNDFYAAWAE